MASSPELLFKVFQKINNQELSARLTIEALQEKPAVRDFYANIPARIDKERDLRSKVDDMCIAFATQSRVVQPTLEHGIFFYERFVFGALFAQSLRSYCVASPQANERDLTLWLLNDYWREYGAIVWRTSLLNPGEPFGPGML
jgi:hypothetical protein